MEVGWHQVDVPLCEVGLENIQDVEAKLKHERQTYHHENKAGRYGSGAQLVFLQRVYVDQELLDLIAMPHFQQNKEQAGKETD